MDIYCEGKNCIKKETCKKHYITERECVKYIDYSTNNQCGEVKNFKLYEKVDEFTSCHSSLLKDKKESNKKDEDLCFNIAKNVYGLC
jgi:hypothetical protein